jgi:hypothetical protein
MMRKLMIGLIALPIASAAITMSASAQNKKGVTVTIPRHVCETQTVDTKNWGKQSVRVCGPPGARAQAGSKEHQQMKQNR